MSLEFTDKREGTHCSEDFEHKGKGRLLPNRPVSRKSTQLSSRKVGQRDVSLDLKQ